MPVTGWNPLGLNSADLPVPSRARPAPGTSMGQVGSSELGHFAGFRFPAGGRICSDAAGICRADSLAVSWAASGDRHGGSGTTPADTFAGATASARIPVGRLLLIKLSKLDSLDWRARIGFPPRPFRL